MNPNNNKNFNEEALRINRALKKRIDKAIKIIDDVLENGDTYDEEDYQYSFEELKEILSWDAEHVTNNWTTTSQCIKKRKQDSI